MKKDKKCFKTMDFDMSEEDAIIHQLKLLLTNNNTQNKSITTASLANFNNRTNSKFDANDSIHLNNCTSQYYATFENSNINNEWKIIALFGYCLIVLVSFFGNLIVCQIVFWSSTMRSTTNIYIGSLSVSDLLMTVFNIPLQLTQILSRDWPFNRFLCQSMPFLQGLSVNVSSFTIACIALDRYQVVAHPLKPRPSQASVKRKLCFTWLMAILASSPYPAIADVEEEFTFRKIIRCRLLYPEPKMQVRLALTLIIMIIQYLGPLSVAIVTYYKICCIIWNRTSVGILSEKQRNQRYNAKWKTIKMLIIVLLVFAVCWFPINVYHIYQDLRGVVGIKKHNPDVVLFCHLIAMSSICYNPFVYCWLNNNFREKAKVFFQILYPKSWRIFKKTSDKKLYKNSSKALRVSNSAQLKYSYRLKISQIHSTRV